MGTTELWIATGNAKKRAELERLLAPLGYRLRLQSELAGFTPPLEDQPDFAGNARVKARALALAAHGFALGDDSGLCVDALGGRPGVHSARYAGPHASDQDRIARLLGELSAVPRERRTARFVCAICVCDPEGRPVLECTDACEGVLLAEPRGGAGFGYDPLFVARDHLDRPHPPTFAELDAAEKDRISHRGRALRALRANLQTRPLGLRSHP
ncbi:MAG: RdgB/HAM1 family non-canonical purine NTP pyrophosphatase [Planctomycetes bacterium]|nr:RdgB/HAM1 family non-canonical purine NTP pyrophosphatase [Planctomycetota bacterium]